MQCNIIVLCGRQTFINYFKTAPLNQTTYLGCSQSIIFRSIVNIIVTHGNASMSQPDCIF
ncbi:uncharacterized protein TrAFT101_011521 [Trichoderma asperellum]|uniref:uncharacterized protein n=1 Tax=Trichoderma asperellum TaxID=101201 RepID=UPI00331B53E6|nr:hypothetical protein TrAFT101_011521 [Trichoderma asperellum]